MEELLGKIGRWRRCMSRLKDLLRRRVWRRRRRVRRKEEMLLKGEEIGRWRMVEVANRERARRKKVETRSNKERRVEDKRWIWSEERRSLEEDEEE